MIVYVTAFLLILTSCSSQKTIQINPIEKKNSFELYKIKIDTGGKFQKYLLYLHSNQQDVSKPYPFIVKEVWTQCEGKRVDFAPEKIELEGEYNVFIPAYFFAVETRKVLDSLKCNQINFLINNQVLTFEPNFQEVDERFFPIPKIYQLNDSLFLFSLDLIRIKPSGEEYFQTSERLRIYIKNNLGKIVWSSDFDLNFLQIIGKVEPEEVGKVRRYLVPWNRISNERKFVESGEFEVVFILPIKPNNIVRKEKLILNKVGQ